LRPIYPYEMDIIKTLEEHKRIFIPKSRGSGISELMLRYILYSAMSLNLAGNYIIVTGPNWNLSRTLIKRMKLMLERNGVYVDDKEIVLNIQGAHIESFPSHNSGSFRSLTDIRIILCKSHNRLTTTSLDK
ncbi:MAG: hypothetical protein WCF06_02280, partial [Nitrososphaeraceae archaeon]